MTPRLGPDFEAEVRFLSSDQGGRKEPARQGFRTDIKYADEEASNQAWMVWPLFVDETGVERSRGELIPEVSRANFYIVSPESRRLVHVPRLRVGTRFIIVEGSRRVAECTVTRVLHLHANAAESPSD